MDIVEIIKVLAAIDTQPIVLYRSFIKLENSVTIKKRLNDIVEEYPELTDIVVALSIYPALVWSLKGKEITAVMGRIATPSERIKTLEMTQELIVKVSGMQPRLLLEQRKKYFEACEEVVKLIDSGIDKVKSYPENGTQYYVLLCAAIGKEVESVPSRFLIKKNLKDAVEILHSTCASKLDELLDQVLNGYVVDDDEMQAVYHNTTLLLKEYNRIVWYAQTSDDRAMQLLTCGSEAEMIALTESDSKYCQSYRIIEYAKLISGAVELVKDFPIYGEEYYKILSLILEAKPQKVRDDVMAKKLGISTFTYSVRRRQALAILGCILWGCDGDTYIRLLTSEN